uniref:CCHC-type domain-containing protein n=1 Tax=Cannabis sativa TaxID=3483 RepID=A0A803QKD5_CANSA
MDNENLIALHASGESAHENENGPSEIDSQQTSSKDEEDKLNNAEAGHKNDVHCENGDELLEVTPEKNLIGSDSDMEIEDLNSVPAPAVVHKKDGSQCEDSRCIAETNLEKDVVDNSSFLQVNVKLTENVLVAEASNTGASAEIGCLASQEESSIGIKKMGGSCILLFMYYTEDPIEALESGEETFFPALNVGLEKTSSVSFWMDKQTRKEQNKDFVELDCNSVPLYDRGFALGLTSDDGINNIEGGVEIIDDAARCFNCGSYNHSLNKCPKPRDRVAVNNARKQLKSKRNQNSASRNQTRYYQNSPAGKYDGLRPGALDAETRQLLGLSELDPPPWLRRMREIGYPPGYLDPDDEDQPSGIIIFGDIDIAKDGQEDGEIIETPREPQKKKSVEFPGINGPIPENADERLWAASPSSSDISRNRSHRRPSYVSEQVSRGHQREERWSSREQRDDGPPGVDDSFSSATYFPRYGSYESNYNSHPVGRFDPDRGRRSRFVDEGYLNHGSVASSYPPRLSPIDYGSSRYENWVDESRNGYDPDNLTPWDRHRHPSRR